MDLGNEKVFRYARPELYSDSESSQENMVEGVAESETGNNQIVLWRGTEAEAEEEENQPLPPLLAFEAIPCLKNKYREDVRGAGRDCPRMCRQKFQQFTLKGFPLSELYETLGNTRVIESILQPSEDEVIMLAGVMERNEEEDIGDIVPENWTRRLVGEKKPIFWKEICKIDVDARDNKELVNHPVAAKNDVGTEKVVPLGIVEQLQSLQKSMDAQFLRISARMDGFDTRLCSVEQYVKETRREREGPGDEGGEVFRNDVEHEHDQAGEKLESLKPKKKQKEPKQKEPEQKEVEQKEAEQKEAEQKETEQKEAEQKESEQKEAEQKEAEQKEAEQKEAEQKEAEQKEPE
ncbi:uncharacterized protein At3g43530-like [Eutrema salsugineum]|uniref:uncharacterized protein At3g43530-like n=1 Tax=Eutrema salsugineum TaxID=72664 RepID=UPI000CECEA2E|nr:uncharacterized protein At3g43530-like [Eutrema salsugineum]